ncbi:hypothetical protein B296_00030368 [Ensete ventricosum]|uniref:Uncharacterized protein n=1 Tax=Ensete ventricosum TaxID=4639 RepID=A0A426YKH6_ENSVE|nr:hypothetical protein B296_00030368 [Ensete ventricosum]
MEIIQSYHSVEFVHLQRRCSISTLCFKLEHVCHNYYQSSAKSVSELFLGACTDGIC